MKLIFLNISLIISYRRLHAAMAVGCAVVAVLWGINARANTVSPYPSLSDSDRVHVAWYDSPNQYHFDQQESYLPEREQSAFSVAQFTLQYTTPVTEITHGGTISYALTLTNLDVVSVSEVTLSAYVPSCMEYVPDTLQSTLPDMTYESTERRATWQGTVTAQQVITLTWTVKTLPDLLPCEEEIIGYAKVDHASLTKPLMALANVSYRHPIYRRLIVTKHASRSIVAPGTEVEIRITVENPGEISTGGLVKLFDYVPRVAQYVPNSLAIDDEVVSANYDSLLKMLEWQRAIPALSTSEFRYRIRILDRVDCGTQPTEAIYTAADIDRERSILKVPIIVHCTEPAPLTDFGDAPDSDSNHHNLNNTAYTDDGTFGHFPTVWDGTPPNEPSGPTHGIASFLLGYDVDAEHYADINLQTNPASTASNILNNGQEDMADGDLDDGWWSWGVPLLNCEVSTLLIRVSRSDISRSDSSSEIDQLWLNVWFDGNRDGDWNDTGSCVTADGETTVVYEWIVQDYAIAPSSIPAQTYLEVQVPTALVLNQQREREAWMRITLSEQKALVPPAGGLPDGRGPAYPAFFAVGETEDWLVPGVDLNTAAAFVTKQASVTETVPGATIEYTITAKNVGGAPLKGFVIEEYLSPQTQYIAESIISEHLTASVLPPNQRITFTGTIPPFGTVTVRYQVRVYERIDCQDGLFNYTIIPQDMWQDQNFIRTLTSLNCTQVMQLFDFGDAPDSISNHYGMENTAYTDDGTRGRFPTVWEGTPPGEPSGPAHAVKHFWLGEDVTAEWYADVYQPSPTRSHSGDVETNILNNGYQDVADQDSDEGWWNPGVPLLNCEMSMLVVPVSKSDLPTDIDRLWLNAWFDGNRDGDWSDTSHCVPHDGASEITAYEWIIQDYPIDVSSIPTGTYLELRVPTVAVMNQEAERDAWLRVMLSEQQAIKPSIGGLPDGRGPVYPRFFVVGETEDWLVAGIEMNNVQPFRTEHVIESEIPSTIGAKVNIHYWTDLPQDATPAITELTHQLPAEVSLQESATVDVGDYDEYSQLDSVTPFPLTFDAKEGPSGTYRWRGQIGSNAYMIFAYEARIDRCPPPDTTGQPQLRSIVTIRQSDGTYQDIEATLPVDCVPGEQFIHQLYLPVVSR